MSIILTITAKGQITLRREVLEHLGARPGDKVLVDLEPNRRLQLATRGKRPISAMYGMLAKPGTPRRSIGELREAAAAGWAGEAVEE